MNEVLVQFIGNFVIVHLDDILIFSRKREENLDHLEMVMKKLHEEKLHINLEKYKFFKFELVYLSFVISKGCLKMNPGKVEDILNWPSPKVVRDVMIFHGLATFYRKFIRCSIGIVAPILDTIKGGVKCQFRWTRIVERSF